MADKNATGKKAAHGEELVQRTRKAVLNAFDAVEKRGKVISEILADTFEENPIKFMELASKLMPKELTGTIDHNHTRIDNMSKQEINAQLTEIERLAGLLATTQGTTAGGTNKEASKGKVH